MTAQPPIRLRAAALLTGLSLFLSGCFISPGKFTSELQLLDNDEFSFTYEGEIFILGLSQLAEMRAKQTEPEFTARCYSEIGDGERETMIPAPPRPMSMMQDAAVEETIEDRATTVPAPPPISISRPSVSESRDCTPEEEAEQRAEWEERQERRLARDREQAEQFSKLFGGIDPTDPEAEQDLAKILMRQKGFDRVVAKGGGLFEVSYSITGTLTHDYMFPMMEDFPTVSPFVQMFVRDGDLVRINAPGLVPQSASNPILPLLGVAKGFGGGGRDNELEAMLASPQVEGTFTIVTTGDVRANNTDEGTVSEGTRQRLSWTINSRSAAPPTALIAKAP